MAAITPKFVLDFETGLNAVYEDSWAEVLNSGLWWDRVTARRESSNKAEVYEWMLNSARIRRLNSKGTDMKFRDIANIAYTIENDDFGEGLKLSRNEIMDNSYGDKPGMWAQDMGASAAYLPQELVTDLILKGKTERSYDEVPFFSTNHPLHPYEPSLGTYSNLFTGKPLSAENLALVCAEIAKIRQPNGAPRYLKPSILLVDPSNQLKANVITQAEIFTDPTNSSGGAPATNVIKTAYGFGQPIVSHELITEPGVWYIGCQVAKAPMQGAFVYQERESFSITSYSGATQAELSRMNMLEWHVRGRAGASYGHPFLFFRVEPT